MTSYRHGVVGVLLVGLLIFGVCGRAMADWKTMIEADWDRQASGGSITPTKADRGGGSRGGSVSTREDAWGAVDGVKNGGTGFHTNSDRNPWWQVDLGKAVALDRAELTNREDCADRANHIMVLLSTDGKTWRRAYQHDGTTFHGGPDKKPLTVALHGAKARYVRLTLPGNSYLHLDEVEVYASADKTKNIALGRPCNQSSTSTWSTRARNPKAWKKGGTPPKVASDDKPEAPKYAYKSTQLTEAFELARKTLAYVAKAAPQPKLAARLKQLEAKFAGENVDATAAYKEVRWLRREIIMAHPLLKFNRLLINKRPPPGYSHQCDQYLGRHSRPGPGLAVLDNWKSDPKVSLLLEGKLPEGTVTHPDLDFEGKKILFAFCDHTEQNRSLRRFFIYEIGIDGKGLRQLTGNKNDKLIGWHNRETVLIEDFDPCYLPGGGFAFVSTRGQAFGRCHGSRYVPNFLLYGADNDGSNIRQLSYGEANEWDPSVLNDGRIIYTRWDYINRHDTFYQSLWTTRPDGTATAHFYGNYTRNPCMTAEGRAIPGSHKACSTAMAHHSYTTGSIFEIDPRKGEDGVEPIKRITPETRFPETEGYPKGVYCTPWPLNEEIYLVAYTPNQMMKQPRPQETNAYGIYLIDTLGGRELVYRDPEMSCFQPIPVQPRFKPPALPSSCIPDAKHPMTGVFQISDVHMSVEKLPAGSIKRVRVNRIHGQVTNRKPWLSTSNNEILKSVVGTAPVNADGSITFRAPAGLPLQLQLLDANNMAVMTMRSFVYLHDGETQGCIGCHEPRDATPPPPRATKLVELDPPVGPKYEGGFSFARTTQPVLDRHCIGCHGLTGKAPKGINLLGTPTGRANLAHDSLVKDRGLVVVAYRNRETAESKPKDYFAHAGRLAKHILSGHKDKDGKPRVNLDAESFERLVAWLDLNAQYYGDYSHNRAERRRMTGDGEKALRAHIAATFGKELAAQPIDALVNIAMPTESRILKAPLAVADGGWGQIKGGWGSRNDPGYKKTLALIQAGIPPMSRVDVAGTCGSEDGRGCRCGGCWTRAARADYLKKVTVATSEKR